MSKTFDLIIESLKQASPEHFDNKLSSETPIFGGKGTLDSLGLVTFLIILEQNIEDELGLSITIADEKAMSLKNSPFKTIGSLENYLNERKDEIE